MNCSLETLQEQHAYSRFITHTMAHVTGMFEAMPLHTLIEDTSFPEIKAVVNVSLITASWKACNAWRAAQHKRHMLVVYGKEV